MEKPILNSLGRLLALITFSVFVQLGCGLRRHPSLDLSLGPGSQPDKILFERATEEIKSGRYDVGRLTLQTLLNTYPDSEYLAKAKLAIADSYYAEGGVSGLTQAEAEYKDFITFFPTAPEAPEAQYRAGMSHFRLMGKADRDLTETRLAEAEFKEFLLKYPDSPTMPRVKGRLRQVQEVLAEGNFRVAKFYYMRQANRAAKSRFQEIADRYPNYSQADSALLFLGQTLERLKAPQEAAPYYARIITDYPLSPLVKDAKGRLIALRQPIPQPTRATLARAQADEFSSRTHHREWFARFTGIMSSAPDLSATRHGPAQLGPPRTSETEMAKSIPSGAPSSGSPNTIVAQQVSDASLKSGKAVGTESTSTAATEASGDNAGKNGASKDKPAPDPNPPAKKKGRFHLLKKLIKPF